MLLPCQQADLQLAQQVCRHTCLAWESGFCRRTPNPLCAFVLPLNPPPLQPPQRHLCGRAQGYTSYTSALLSRRMASMPACARLPAAW